MAASVRIEDEAFGEPRIELLGELAGYNRYEALGRLAHLWRMCTHRQQHIVSETVVTACLGPRGVEALIGAELGERAGDGIRVRGTAGRIEWLQELRERAAAGGRSRAARRLADAKQTASESQADASPGVADARNSLADASQKPAAFVPPLCPPSPSPSPSGIRERERPARSTGIARRVRKAHIESFNELRPDGVPEMQDHLGSDGESLIAALVVSLMAEFKGDTSKVEDTLMYALSVRSHEARESQSVEYFGDAMWRADNFGRARTRKIGDKRERASSQGNPPARKFRVL